MNAKVRITVPGLMGNSVFMTVPHFHSVGETLSAQSLYMEPGGKGCNQAVAAARLGAGVSFISCMGEDGTARECIEFMEREGIECLTQYTASSASSYACILTDSEGENQVTVHRGSAEYLSAEFIGSCESAIAASDILLLNNECPLEANMAALEIAEKHGVKAVLNPAPYMPLSIEYLRRFYLITPNRHEAAMLAGVSSDISAEELAQALMSRGIERGVITLGSEGSEAWENGKTFRCMAEKVRAVDTTGAGDCFSAALCCCIGEGRELAEAVRYAGLASGLSVAKKYVMPSLPRREELEKQYLG